MFFQERLPAILSETVKADFHKVSKVPLVLGFLISGRDGVAEHGRWTVEVSGDGLIVSEGRAEKVPLFTVCTPLGDWPMTLPRLELWLKRFRDRLGTWKRRPWDEVKLEKISLFTGTVTLRAKGFVDDSGEGRDLVAEVFLNSHEKLAGRGFGVEVDSDDYDAMLEGRIGPLRAFADGQIKFSGEVILGLKLLMAAR